MSTSKGKTFWGVYAENDGEWNWINGYEQYKIHDDQWERWHNEFEKTLPEGEWVSSNFDQLCEFMVAKAIGGSVVEDPFADMLEEI